MCHGINTAIRKIRQVLKDDPDEPRFIQTVTGKGYRFIAPLDHVPINGNGSGAKGIDAAEASPVDLRGGQRPDGAWLGRVAIAIAALLAVVAVLVGFNVAGSRNRLWPQTNRPVIQSLAVIPLENLSGDPKQDYFADGMTDEIITMNSQLIKMEAIINGYAEGIALDANGLVSEGSGENLFVIRNGVLQTAPLGNSVLPGITRDSVLQIARDLGIPIQESGIPREMLYIADEVFFTGTAAEITPIRSVDKISVGKGTIGPVTKAIQKEFYAIVHGEKADRFKWLTPVPVGSKQPVGV